MVIIAASVITKTGRALVTRQFGANITRARLEGLTDAFPKLVATEKGGQRQHTFVETDSVRYVYQPLDNVYMVLITTKASNILEDLETLRLFSRVIPEYCRSNEEAEISDKAFDLIFAFDEIVALGYRESVNLAQVRTFTDMDSHEERVFNQIQIAQQRAATNMMNEKVKEIKRAEKLKKTLRQHGIGSAAATSLSSAGGMGGFTAAAPSAASSLIGGKDTASLGFGGGFSAASVASKSASSRAPAAGGGKALKLGSKHSADTDVFVQQLRHEGQDVAPVGDVLSKGSVASTEGGAASHVGDGPAVGRKPVHFKCLEKVNVTVTRDGALKSCEVSGSMSLFLADPRYGTVETRVRNVGNEGVQFQVHPNLDKLTWQSESVLRLKSAQRSFPADVEVGVMKWRHKIAAERDLPLTFVFWISEDGEGCDLNIEYTMQREEWSLKNVVITVPLPPATAPVVGECDGEYEYLKSKSLLVWKLDVVDTSNKTGVLAFTTPNGRTDHFFPTGVRYASENTFTAVAVESVHLMGAPAEEIDFSSETLLVTEKYEIHEN